MARKHYGLGLADGEPSDRVEGEYVEGADGLESSIRDSFDTCLLKPTNA